MKKKSAFYDVCSEDELNVFKKKFMSQMAHDLRTPLTVLKGSVGNFLMASQDDDLNDAQKQLLKIMERNTNRMQSLLEDFFSVLRLEYDSHLNQEAISLNDLANEVIKFCEEEVVNQDIAITKEISQDLNEIRNDRPKLFQVLKVIISHVIKFSDSNQIQLKIFREQRDGMNVVQFAVITNAKDLAKSEINKLFSRSFCFSGATYKGKALNKTEFEFALCKKIVLSLQGEIWAATDPSEAFMICFTIREQ